jgi:hypothetical protein
MANEYVYTLWSTRTSWLYRLNGNDGNDGKYRQHRIDRKYGNDGNDGKHRTDG